MGDCFPKTGGNIPTSSACQLKTGASEYANNFKQWPYPVQSLNFKPEYNDLQNGDSPWKKRYSFSKGARFGVPPLVILQYTNPKKSVILEDLINFQTIYSVTVLLPQSVCGLKLLINMTSLI